MEAYNDNDRPTGGDSTEMPLGLGMSLLKEPTAFQNFGRLSLAEKSRVIAYVQCSATGEEARRRIDTAVEELARGSTGFIG